ncbi:phosphopantetheine-binding protein [Mesobacillus zeae]|uniref:phosphopantetheine-binding protein n=1 Tax=Mesobacillus zeae TaxID=1917180 RepID=UPI00115C4752|nr:phosphopantetheine-binding protein [Mesobacillus zeae]
MDTKLKDIDISVLKDVISSFSQDYKPRNDISMNDHLVDDLGIDSIALISLVISLEDHFHINITDDMMVPENFETVSSVSIMINTLLERLHG